MGTPEGASGGLGRVVEDDTKGESFPAKQPADAVTHFSPIESALADDRTIGRRKEDHFAFDEVDCFGSGLLARALFGQQESPAGIVNARTAETDRCLQGKTDLAIEIAVHAVVAAGMIAQKQGCRPRLTSGRHCALRG